MRKTHLYFLVFFLFASSTTYSQNIIGDTVKYIDLSQSHNPSDKAGVFIVKVEKQYFYFDTISPKIIQNHEIRRGKFLSQSTKNIKLDSNEYGILIVVKRKYYGIVEERILKGQTRPNTR